MWKLLIQTYKISTSTLNFICNMVKYMHDHDIDRQIQLWLYLRTKSNLIHTFYILFWVYNNKADNIKKFITVGNLKTF